MSFPGITTGQQFRHVDNKNQCLRQEKDAVMETNQEMQEMEAPIELVLVADDLRLDYFPRFDRNILLMVRLEESIFRMLESLCDEYTGGYWNYFTMSNDGFFIELVSDKPLTLRSPNGHEVTVNAHQASIVAILMTLSALCFWAYEQGDAEANYLFVTLHMKLMDYVHQMPKELRSDIYRLID